jgi:parvulin-like peptidyl-prolyl isomerase
MGKYLPILYGWLFLLVVMLILVSCSNNTSTPTEVIWTDTPLFTPIPTLTATPFPPSPTPIPLAALVNGEMITMAEFQAELARYKTAQRETASPLDVSHEKIVLDDLIDQVLLSQGAQQAGFEVDETLFDERWNKLVDDSGGEQEVMGWLAENGYTEESFRTVLARAIAAAWMRDQILDAVPNDLEQVHARQILLYNLEQAQEVLAQLESGNDFATLAATFDPVLSGDLGWFPRGYLPYAQLEQAVFDLQPLEYSEIVETPLGFHILQLIERDPERDLDPDARLTLQAKALQDWLEERRKQSDIEISLPGLNFEQ